MSSGRVHFVAPSAYPLGGVAVWLDYLVGGLTAYRYLRYQSLVRGLGELKVEWDTLDDVRRTYSAQFTKIHRHALFENWTPARLTLGEAVAIDRGTVLCWQEGINSGHIKIGEHTWIGPYNNLRAAENGKINIGSRCYVSQFCSFISHNYGIRRDALIQQQGLNHEKSDIYVGDDVWFGVGCAVMPGVEIGNGAVIGAGSIVTKSVPPYEIWAGAAARKIGERE